MKLEAGDNGGTPEQDGDNGGPPAQRYFKIFYYSFLFCILQEYYFSWQ